MRGALLFAIYGGDAWVAAGATIALVAIASILGLFDGCPRLLRVARVITIVAVAVAALTGTPVALPLAIPAVVAVIAFAGTLDHPSRRARIALALVTLSIASFFTIREAIPIYRSPRRAAPARSMVLLGDSLSSGGFGETERWPEIVARRCGIAINDRSSPSATAADAAAIAASEPGFDSKTVFLEVGGNDMLDGRRASEFLHDLDAVVASARARDVVMLEFPVVPGRWAFASAQRRVARRYGATLIPKRILAAVLTDPRNTFDGLHLTDRGHDELARRIMPWLGCAPRRGDP